MNDTPQLSDTSNGLARYLHARQIDISLNQVKDQLLKDLAKLYRLKEAGQPVEIPTEVTIKDVVVRLS